jgi:hypothetical protein
MARLGHASCACAMLGATMPTANAIPSASLATCFIELSSWIRSFEKQVLCRYPNS